MPIARAHHRDSRELTRWHIRTTSSRADETGQPLHVSKGRQDHIQREINQLIMLSARQKGTSRVPATRRSTQLLSLIKDQRDTKLLEDYVMT
jgi:hypothetical protein